MEINCKPTVNTFLYICHHAISPKEGDMSIKLCIGFGFK